MAVKPVEKEAYTFYDVRREPFSIHGLYRPLEPGIFRRLPEDVAEATNPGVADHARKPAGGRIRFSADCDRVAIHMHFVAPIIRREMMSPLASSGCDLYLDDPAGGMSRFYAVFRREDVGAEEIWSEVVFADKKRRFMTIHLPPFAVVDQFEVGLPLGVQPQPGLPYLPGDPIVYYGSSITHGACASRPGNSYPNVVCQRTRRDYLNLGFSGSAKGEPAIVGYLAGLPMSLFVLDYDHNAPTPEHLAATHAPLYRAVRATHPDIPIIMISRPNFPLCREEGVYRRREVILDTFRSAREAGDRNVYFIDGSSVVTGPWDNMALVDGTHPTDLGFALLADAVCAVLSRLPFYGA